MHDDEGTCWVLRDDPTAFAGRRVAATGDDLDEWLAARGGAPLAARLPVLAYGSNACPAKIGWLREELGLRGPVVVLGADCADLAAVWTTGTRSRDGQRVATLAAAPGARERHAIWFADAAQLDVLDVCEVRGHRYRLALLESGRITLDDGAVLRRPLAYLGHDQSRQPLLVDGNPVRCAQVDQAAAITLTGSAGADGLRATDVTGHPQPASWPDRLFVYGTLRPGRAAWPIAEPLTSAAHPARVRGRLYDTGLRYPALVPGDGEFAVPGHVLTLHSPADALAELDTYEGAGFDRARTVLADGTVCWIYYWNRATEGLRPIPGWP